MKKILIIEDNNDNMELMRQILTDEGYSVITAKHAEHGIQQLYTNDVALVLMDLSLPEMDGMQAVKLIRNNPDIQGVPIIVVTAHTKTSTEERAMNAGCNAYLSKPINETEFLQTIQKQLQ